MRRAFVTTALTSVLAGVALATAAGASAVTCRAPGSQAAPARAERAKWACVATDDGAQNPGPGCPGGNSHGYKYPGITNSNGYTTFVNNDMWNPPGAGHPQTIYVNNPGDWEAVSDQAKGNTSVLSYPSVQQIFTQSDNAPAPISGFSTLLSNYTESMPSGGDNESAFDIWLGTSTATDYSQEVMIWQDDHRTNPPPGKVAGHTDFFGTPYTVWDDTTSNPGTIYFVRDANATSTRVHIITMLKWLENHSLSPKGSGINDIEFGWEICSTNGQPWVLTMTRYQLISVCEDQASTACWSS